MYLKLQKIFNIDPLCKDWVMRSAGKKWRDFKSMLKKEHFKEELSLEENIANGCRRRVPHSDWVALCEYWNFPSTKEKARKNKENRANQKNARHTSGSRCFARARFIGVSIILNCLHMPGSQGIWILFDIVFLYIYRRNLLVVQLRELNCTDAHT